MTPAKRVLDLTMIVILSPILIVAGAICAALILLLEGRPVFYRSERMRSVKRGFVLWKFRTMTVVAEDGGASGGDKTARITRLGRILRKTHADEIPQAWNVIRGDLSLVGPRPPLRVFVERFPEIYGKVLQSRPGVTGLASFFYAGHEGRLLQNTQSAAETDAIYVRRCIPRKAQLDLIYQRRRTIWMDLWLMWITIAAIVRLPGRRPIQARGGSK